MCRAFWEEHPCITVREMAMLCALCEQPHCLEAIATMLDEEIEDTRRLLAALNSVGLVEWQDEGYGVTEATLLYCRLNLGDPPLWQSAEL